MSQDGRGTLFLVVGPSGAGKDSLLAGARAALAEDPRFVFPRRVITRPADAGGEDHQAVTDAEFEALRARGAFALWWDAHGLRYGVPKTIEADLASGRNVVVNVSRGAVDEARDRLAPVVVLSVTVPEAALRARLTARGRETPAEIEKRVARAMAYELKGPDVVEIDNGGALDDAVTAFVAVLLKGG